MAALLLSYAYYLRLISQRFVQYSSPRLSSQLNKSTILGLIDFVPQFIRQDVRFLHNVALLKKRRY